MDSDYKYTSKKRMDLHVRCLKKEKHIITHGDLMVLNPKVQSKK